MFFQEHEKLVYHPPLAPPDHKGYDPLAVDRALTAITGGKLADLIEDWKAPGQDTGDVSPEGKAKARVYAAAAEGELAKASRAVFGLPEFPECTDGVALEYLCHYLEYMEGKGSRPCHGSCSAGPAPGSSYLLHTDTRPTSGSSCVSNGTGPNESPQRVMPLRSELDKH